MKVFISYTNDDKLIAERLYSDLADAGFLPWMDKERMLVGQDWEKVVEKEIIESSYFILIVSAKSVSKRGPIRREINIALDKKNELFDTDVYIIPVFIEDCELQELALKKLHRIDLYPLDENYEDGFQKIIHAMGSVNSALDTLSQDSAESALPSRDVLIVDDKDQWQDLISEALENVYSYDVASTIEEAFEKLESQRFKLVCCNLEIHSVVYGKKFLTALKEKHNTIPVVLVSGTIKQRVRRLQQKYPNIKDIIIKDEGEKLIENLLEAVSELI